ncbi:protein of unknown function [Alkalibacterium subtropicum]|uniref:DUF937 domain-containing protein n=1 Tax=Alkalibacterium subtropicum TaxID=753702 RepID=A0A1I1EDP8_9LACT|nr:DUF937 domain-containing protein [Alkalibacterium subtropicum]SFB83043.1 protein of unknown function [Alkalibacterium subtropicum]
MDIVSMIMNQLGNQDRLSSVAKRANTDTSTVQKIAQIGLPMIMDGLNKRTSEDAKASEELASTASRHADDDTDDLNHLLENTDKSEGNHLLDMAFGSSETEVEKRVAQKTGTDSSTVKSILSMLAPVALSMVAKHSSNSQSLTGSGVSQLLDGLTNSVKQQSSGSGYGEMLSSVLGDSSDSQNNTVNKAKDALGDLFNK